MVNILEENISKQGTRSSIRLFQQLDRNATGSFSSRGKNITRDNRQRHRIEVRRAEKRGHASACRLARSRPFTFGYAAVIAAITSFKKRFRRFQTSFARCTFAASPRTRGARDDDRFDPCLSLIRANGQITISFSHRRLLKFCCTISFLRHFIKLHGTKIKWQNPRVS